MVAYGIMLLITGLSILVMSILLILGHVNLLHDYHRNNVKTEDEKKDFREQISDIFKRYGLKGDFTTTLNMIKKQFEDYASGNSEDKGFRQYVNDEAAGLFDDMQKYWGSLMNRVNGHS